MMDIIDIMNIVVLQALSAEFSLLLVPENHKQFLLMTKLFILNLTLLQYITIWEISLSRILKKGTFYDLKSILGEMYSKGL